MNKRSKGSRETLRSGSFRKDRSKTKMPPKNRYSAENVKLSDENISTSAKKLKRDRETSAPENPSIGYRILNFLTVFSALSECVKCKKCNSDVRFSIESTRGLGFKIVVSCSSCKPTFIPSCPNIKSAYEINTRFFFVMRLLGLGLRGAMKFCGLMDLPPPLQQRTYDLIIDNIHSAASTIAQLVLKQAVKEEQEEIKKENSSADSKKLTVSGDGTWRKRGFTSLYGVAVLIGHYTGKVVDFIVKSAYCAECNYWNKHNNTEQYEEWKSNHEENCQANHVGSAGKMEVDAMKELFFRSVEKHEVMYTNYIGDGDSKTYTGLLNAKPYGDDVDIIKKECVGHVQKRMGTRLRECKKKNPGIGGKNKLTIKLLDKLSIYYGLAIRRNSDSKDNMKNAIWATFHHYGSTDSKPQHHLCPKGPESWCKWQRAEAQGGLQNFRHDYVALPKTVLDAIKPIYEDLSTDKLLERCVGGYTQNSNESFNQMIWKIAPKSMHSGAKIVNIAAFLATCTFNNGVTSLLEVMNVLGISLGSGAHLYAAQEDETRIAQAEQQAQEHSRGGRIRRRQQNLEAMNVPSAVEDLCYGPGIDNSI